MATMVLLGISPPLSQFMIEIMYFQRQQFLHRMLSGNVVFQGNKQFSTQKKQKHALQIYMQYICYETPIEYTCIFYMYFISNIKTMLYTHVTCQRLCMRVIVNLEIPVSLKIHRVYLCVHKYIYICRPIYVWTFSVFTL